MRKASCFSILAPQRPQRKSRVAVDYQNSRLINSFEYFRFHSVDELCKTKNKSKGFSFSALKTWITVWIIVETKTEKIKQENMSAAF